VYAAAVFFVWAAACAPPDGGPVPATPTPTLPPPAGGDSVDPALLEGPLPYRGVNLAGADFGVGADGSGLPGRFGIEYTYPDPAYVSGYESAAYFVRRQMTTFRLPFRWERLQPVRGADFDAAELARLETTVEGLLAKGAVVVLDPHNYARYGTAVVGGDVPISDFADLWRRLAVLFGGRPRVLFGLVNEPNTMPTEQWAEAAQTALLAIRGTGAGNLVLVPGNGWSGAFSWYSNWYGTPNAVAMLSVTDPGGNMAYEVHQYMDADGSGTGTCVSGTVGSERLRDFTAWLRLHGKKAFLGEFGGDGGATCQRALDDMLDHVEANDDVYLGWAYWAAGPWWGDYFSSLEPKGGVDAPQMGALVPHLGPR
jgi:endoglucanase